MAYGEARRDVAQATQQPQVQAGTVPLGLVMAPQPARRGDTSIGETFRKLGNWASDALMKEHEKEVTAAKLDGTMQYMQGKTLQELQETGEDVFTKQGWIAMDSLTAVQKFHTAEKLRIETEDAAIDPDEWRVGMAQRYAGMIEGRSDFEKQIIVGAAERMLPDLTQAQMLANAKYKQTQTVRAGIEFVQSGRSMQDASGEDVGKSAWLAGVQDGPLARMSPQMRDAVLSDGIVSAMENDNLSPLTWAKEAGMLAELSPESQIKLRKAEADYRRRAENKFDEQYTVQRTQMLEELRTGKLSLTDALRMDKALQESRGWVYDQDDASGLVREFRAEQGQLRAEARAEARADIREARAMRKQEERDAQYRQQLELSMQWSLENMERTRKLQAGELTYEQFLQDSVKAADDIGLKLTAGMASGLTNDVARAHSEGVKLQAQKEVLEKAVSTNTLYALPPAAQEAAFEAERARTSARWQAKMQDGSVTADQAVSGMIEDTTRFVAENGVVDKVRANRWTALAMGAPVKADGEVREQDQAGLREWMALYSKNKALALDHLKTPEARAAMLQMADAYRGSGDYAAAVRDAMLVMQTPKEQLPPVPQSAIEESVQNVLDRQDTGVFSAVFGRARTGRAIAAALDPRSAVTALQQKAQEEVIKSQIQRLTEQQLATRPGVSPEIAAEAAAHEVSRRYTVIAGALIAQPSNSTVRDKMFSPNAADDMLRRRGMEIPNIPASSVRDIENVEDDALRLVVQKHGKSLWKTFGKTTTGEMLANPVDAALDAVGTPRLLATRHPSGEGLLVKYQTPDDEWSEPAYVSFREMGIVWSQDYAERIKNEDAQRRNRAAPMKSDTTTKILLGG